MHRHPMRDRVGVAAAHVLGLRPARALLAFDAVLPLTLYPDVEWELERCEPRIAFPSPVPPGSLGDACTAFCAEHRLAPMRIGFDGPDTPAHKLAARRLLLHDVLHVLLGFGADWPGEYGVFCFVAAQDYCPQFERAARRIGQLYTTATPWLRDAFAAAEFRARQLAVLAPRLLSMPIEQHWTAPLFALQVRLNLRRERRLRAIDWRAPETAAPPRAHAI